VPLDSSVELDASTVTVRVLACAAARTLQVAREWPLERLGGGKFVVKDIFAFRALPRNMVQIASPRKR